MMSLHRPQSAADPNLTVDRLSQRIAEGENPQDLLEELIAYAKVNVHSNLGITKPIWLLVENGARAATGQKGCAFEMLIREPDPNPSMAFSGIISGLLKNADEIPLHILAGHSPTRLLAHLSHTTHLSEKIKAGIHKRDANGRTLSHWLWMQDGVLTEQASQARAADATAEAVDDTEAGLLAKRWFSTLQSAWKTQTLLNGRGIGMDTPDNNGVTAMDLCLERLEAEDAVLWPDYEICQRVEACRAARQMNSKTPPASANARGGLRF